MDRYESDIVGLNDMLSHITKEKEDLKSKYCCIQEKYNILKAMDHCLKEEYKAKIDGLKDTVTNMSTGNNVDGVCCILQGSIDLVDSYHLGSNCHLKCG